MAEYQVAFRVDGLPVGKERPYSFVVTDKAGQPVKSPKGRFMIRHFNRKRTSAFEQAVAFKFIEACRAARAPVVPWTGPVEMDIDIDLPVPKSFPQWKRALALAWTWFHTTKPDLSNVLKAVEDGLNGVAYRDDAQIWRATQIKRYGQTPGVTVQLWFCKQPEKGA